MTKTELPAPTYAEMASNALKRWGVRQRWECWHPLIIGTILGVGFLFIPVTEKQTEDINTTVLPLAVSVAAILAGFQGAMHAIFLSVMRTKTVRYLRDKNAYQSLMRYIRSGVVSLVLFVAIAMLVIAASAIDMLPPWHRAIYGSLCGVFAYSLLASSRIMMLLLRLLQHADEQT